MKMRVIREYSLGKVVISEQAGSDSDFIKLADGVNLEELTKGDKNPLFVTKEVLHEGVSVNKREYDRKMIKEVYKQILQKKPNAYKGHIIPEQRDSANPNSRTIWIGAGLKEVDGKLAVYAKGYVLPKEVKFKDYLRRAVAAGKEIPTSIHGMSEVFFDSVKKVIKVAKFDLESIDWARDLSEGVKSLDKTVLLTNEMSSNLDDTKMDYTKITLKGLRENRPDLLEKIEQKSASSQLVTEMSKALGVEAEKLNTVITEQAQELEKAKVQVTEMRQAQGENVLNEILDKKVSDPAIRLVAKTLTSGKVKEVISEMTDNFDQEAIEKVVVTEMSTPEMVAMLKTKQDKSFGQDDSSVVKSAGLTKKVPYKRN